MFRSVIFFIGFRYIYIKINDQFSKLLSKLSVLGIALGIMALITVTSVMNGFENSLQKKILSYMPQVILTTPKGHFHPSQYPLYHLSYLKGIKSISSIIESEVILHSKNNISIAIMIGVDNSLGSSDPILNHLQEPKYYNYNNNINIVDRNRNMILTAGSYNVILGINLAERLGVKIGDQLRIIIPDVSQFTPFGRIPSQRLFTVVRLFETKCEADNSEILVNNQDAVRLLRYPIGNITGWRLYLKAPLTVDSLSQQILPTGLLWKDWREKKGEFFQAVKMEKNIMSVLISLIIAVSIFNLITALSLLIIEKKSEVAILQTLGMKRNQIMVIFMFKGVAIGIMGTILGTLLGILTTIHINQIMFILGFLEHKVELQIDINLIQIILIDLFTLCVSLLASIYPAWWAANVNPTEVLRYE